MDMDIVRNALMRCLFQQKTAFDSGGCPYRIDCSSVVSGTRWQCLSFSPPAIACGLDES